ncbi:hypothetical protein H6G33_38740 [Calothrix sp. FACHB-1219]|uniref:hypothetical protein n=1 Tax=Calothrix sp. FACHB-1219 TaxID=2692778 RepID=UPI001687DE90|nr:hypothetical protein [Calothrix sp. FACHB-1219]MBD2222853.1 hypothetical protein [Calothrix sp. FACHB-1219]
MNEIRLDGRVRVSLADAKALIVRALPVEGGADVYMHLLPDGTPDWDGPIEVKPNPHARRGEIFIDGDLPSLLKELNIEPRLNLRPIWKDFGHGKLLEDYSVSRDEFIKLAECFGIGVVVGEQAADAKPAPDSTSASDLVLKRSALISRVQVDWKSVEGDLREASRNGLRAAAYCANGWSLNRALAWAESRGKLTPTKVTRQKASPWSGL